jgi:hypothetical protein
MEEVIKLVIPIFSTPRNYAEILKKLASFAFYETYLITLLLRANPRFDGFFTSIESWGPIGKVIGTIPHHDALNLSGVVIALVVAVLTHTFQFHDRISDILGIRRRFDIKNILIPLAQRVDSVVTLDKEAKIAQCRDELMHAVFYKYASSRADNPLVDRHDIEHALNAWSWFWVFVEAVFYFGMGAIVALWLGSRKLALIFTIVWIAFLLLAFTQRTRLNGYARPQIETIAGDPTASYAVKRKFDAL